MPAGPGGAGAAGSCCPLAGAGVETGRESADWGAAGEGAGRGWRGEDGGGGDGAEQTWERRACTAAAPASLPRGGSPSAPCQAGEPPSSSAATKTNTWSLLHMFVQTKILTTRKFETDLSLI